MRAPDLRVALAGNPNAGKTSVFNALTGSHQHVGNWPGKTVECKRGLYRHAGRTFEVTDLPGTYSLTAFSIEEIIARDFILHNAPEVVVVVVDAPNLERNLYLLLQIVELESNVVVALNRCDLADSKGHLIDIALLSAHLGGVPVIPMVTTRNRGVDSLRDAILTAAEGVQGEKEVRATRPSNAERSSFAIDYGPEISAELEELSKGIALYPAIVQHFEPRWLALKLLEGEEGLRKQLANLEGGQQVLQQAQGSIARLNQRLPIEIALMIADRRYELVSRMVQDAVQQPAIPRASRSEIVDAVVTHPLLGLPIFLLVMYFVFNLVVNVSAPYLDWVDSVISGPFTRWVGVALHWLGAPAWLRSLFLEGALPGVGGVLTFVPGLMALFFFIGILEDSGYLARAAVVTDRFMSLLGLRGKSFVPLILGFGCAVPAIYATRTLDNRRDRLLTSLLVPLMSCSARLPIYVVFSLAFFGRYADVVIWCLYALGVLVAAMVGALFSRTIFRARAVSPFVLELPSYTVPTLRSLWQQVARKTGSFVRNAGTVILAASVVIWLLLNLPMGAQDLSQSWFGELSSVIAPVLKPAGFGEWETAGSLVTGLVAKEVVIATMSQVYLGESITQTASGQKTLFQDIQSVGSGFLVASREAGKELIETLTPGLSLFGDLAGDPSTALSHALQEVFTPLSALAFLVFVLLYIPCVATLGAIKAEFGWPWAVFAATWQTSGAWLMATLVFQFGRFLDMV